MMIAGCGPAIAEVCDKAVGESWLPEHGPVWLFNPIGWPTGLTLIVVGFGLAAIFKSRWLAYLISALLASGAVLAGLDLIQRHDVYLSEIREGCRSVPTDLMDAAILLVLAAVFALFGYRMVRTAPDRKES
jgi:hypothetical protein